MGGTARVRVVWPEEDDELEFDATHVRPNGAFLPSDLMFDHGSPLSVAVNLPGVGERVLRAEVVAVDLSGRSYGRPGMGIAFRGLAAVERRALRTLAASHAGAPPPRPPVRAAALPSTDRSPQLAAHSGGVNPPAFARSTARALDDSTRMRSQSTSR